MRILTRTQYDAICDIVMNQKKLIEKKEAEIKRLKAQVERLSYLMDRELKSDSIDFPNSYVHSEIKSPDDRLF